MSFVKKHLKTLIITIAISTGLFIRLYKIDFGLPQIFIADETDIYDEVINFSLNYKFILRDGSINDFEPPTYVYGMFPTYFLTLCTMILNKTASIFNFHINYDFYHIYLRIITALFSLSIPIFSYFIYKEISETSRGSFIAFLLVLFNWKLLVYSRYLNQDIYLTSLVTISLFFFIKYLKSNTTRSKSLFLVLSSIAFGLATGTKITALITLPIIVGLIFIRKNIKDVLLFILGVILSFSISNPFSIINFQSFISRVISMKTREAGAVFSSVNLNPFKYFVGLSNILTLPIFIVGLITILVLSVSFYKSIKSKNIQKYDLSHIFLIGNVFLYMLFFSLNKRLVERWVLPITPILIIYATYGIYSITTFFNSKNKQNIIRFSLLFIFFIFYTIYLITFIKQLDIGDTRLLAYKWTNNFLNNPQNKDLKVLVYTNKGRDPFANIKNCDVQMFRVYESENTINFKPKDPKDYDIIITYSDMENNYKNSYVSEKYPHYVNSWINFENEINNPNNFLLLKSYKTTRLDLMGLSNIYIYQNVSR
ncbi:MAG TPA: phospholipid carrier-dependent glycosyltransferase [bacterium]|nr:phospholipid carrier-dependent glycosyltransferase [bacterium]